MQKLRSLLMICLISFLFANALCAQQYVQVSGKVSDAKTTLPLKNATVSFITAAGKYKIEITDAQGIFNIQLPGEGIYNLQINFTGYKTFSKDSIAINHQTLSSLSFNAAMDTLEKTLQNVTVTAPRQFITQTAEKIVLDVAASPVAAGGNAYDILLAAPGLIEQNNNVQFRGKSVNVLINGRPSNMTSDDLKNFLSSMPANSIDKIEILPNPSAKYDAQGGSVVNIKLAKNKNLGTNGTITAGLGSGRYARYNSGLNLNYRNNKFNLYGSYDYAHNAQYYDNSSNRILTSSLNITEDEHEVRYRNNHSAKIGLDYDINKNNSVGFLVTDYVNFRDRKLSNNSVLNYTAAATDSSSKVFTDGFARFASLSANVYYKTKIDSTGKELTINADYFNYDKNWNDNYSTHFYTPSGTEYAPVYSLMDNSPGENSVKSITADYVQPGKKYTLEAGIKTSFSKTDNNVLWQYANANTWKTDEGKTNHFIYNENIYAAYINYKRQIKKYSFDLGIRAEHTASKGESITLNQINTRDYTNIFPNIAVQYAHSQDVQYGFSYRKSIERFGFDVVNPFVIYQSQYSYYQGNPNIQPMIMHSFEFSHSWKYQLFTSLSYTYIKDAINTVYRQNDASKLIINSVDNLSSASVYNATVTWMKTFLKGKWTTTSTAGAFYAKYSSSSDSIQLQNAKVTGYVNINNTFRFKKGITAELSGYYHSPIASGVYQQKSFSSINAGIAKDVLKGKGNLKLNVKDIFNTQLERYDVLYQNINSSYRNKTESRFINLVFTWKFGSNRIKAVKNRQTGIEDEKSRMGN